jgi:CDP-glucose 4,6-dehydratase
MLFKNTYAGKKVLVLGCTGFKGSWLCEWLLKCGAEVYGIALHPTMEDKRFKPLFNVLNLEEKITFFNLDIRDKEKLIEKFKEIQPYFVFHLAAQALVAEGFINPYVTFSTNTMGTYNVMESILHTSSIKSAVIVTSDKCYENVEWNYGYRETDKLGGADPYSASKACAEIIFSSCARSFFQTENATKIASARAGNVIGGGDFSNNRILPDAVKNWFIQKPVSLRSPNATRPWQHVLEPLSGYMLLAAKLSQNYECYKLHGESFNFGPFFDYSQTPNQTVKNLVAKVSDVFHEENAFAEYECLKENSFYKESTLLKLCCDKADSILHWKPVWNFNVTVCETSLWYINYNRMSQNEMASFTSGQIQKYETDAKNIGVSWA